MNQRRISWLACLALAFTQVACNQLRVRDDIDLTFDFAPLIGPSNLLHQPYVQGSSMRIYVDSVDNRQKLAGWSVRSQDPTIFDVDATTLVSFDANTISVSGTAHLAGVATLDVLDDKGKVAHHVAVTVEAPDHIELDAHGPMLVNRTELDPKTIAPTILDGGTATFLVRYFKGEQLLYGNGALTVNAPDSVTVATPQTYLFEDRDWLQLSPTQAGDYQIPLVVGGAPAATVTLHAVEVAAVTSMHIYGENEAHAHKGDWLVALAQAFDTGGGPIYGVDYHWDLDGDTQTGEGDLYRYQYNKALGHALTATFMAQSATATIHGENGFVDSSNNLGCAAGGANGASCFTLILVAAAAALARRRQT